jgi:hypothetical protein
MVSRADRAAPSLRSAVGGSAFLLVSVTEAYASGSHPPPPVADREFNDSKRVLEDGRASPLDKVRAIETIWWRPCKFRRLALFRGILADRREDVSVRLAASVGILMEDRSEKAGETVARLLGEAMRATEVAVPRVIEEAFCIYGKTSIVPGGTGRFRKLAHAALRHRVAEVRIGGLKGLLWRGTRDDASALRPFLADPLSDEFLLALQVVIHGNAQLAAELRGQLSRIAGAKPLARSVRAEALVACPGPYTDAELRLAARIMQLPMKHHWFSRSEERLIGALVEKGSRPEVFFSLLEIAFWNHSDDDVFGRAVAGIGKAATGPEARLASIDVRLSYDYQNMTRNTSTSCVKLLRNSQVMDERIGAVVVLGLRGPNSSEHLEIIRRLQSEGGTEVAAVIEWAIRRLDTEYYRSRPEMSPR